MVDGPRASPRRVREDFLEGESHVVNDLEVYPRESDE